MSIPYEDKPGPGADDTSPPAGAVTTTTAPAPALVSASGPVAAAGEGTWGSGPGLNVRYAGRSAVGLVREHNEDNFVIANLGSGDVSDREIALTDAVTEGGLLFAVCDGMGGAAAGEVASQMAVDVLLEAMRRGGQPAERDVLARRLVSAVEEAGRRIFDAAQKERSRRGMGTTATAAVLIDKVLFLAEVGDSRAYLLRGGQLKQLTKDQSLVNQLIEAGHLTEAEAEAFEHSNIILQALGTSETVQVDLTFVELRRGDRLMLCSDGLSGLVHGDTLRDTLAGVDDPAECTAALIRFAEAGGGHDNITVVVIDFDGDALEVPRETDSFGYLQYPLVPAASAASTFSEEEVTEATKPLSMGNYDSVSSYHPPAGPGVDTSPWLWISAGLAALLVGTWLLAVGGSVGGVVTALEDAPLETNTNTNSNSNDSNVAAPAEATPPIAEAPATDAKGVPVHVYSDVEDAVLLVNGEAHGPLAMGEGQALDLPPGAYRFEAQSHGNIAAVEVVNIRPEAPVDVYLRLPAGENVPVKPGAPGAGPAAATKAPAQPGGAQPAAPAEPSTPKAAAAPAAEPAKPEAPQTPAAADTKPAVPSKPGPIPAPGATHAAPTAPAPAVPPRRPKPAPPVAAKPHAPAQAPVAPAPSPSPQGGQAPKAAPTPDAKPDSPIPENPF